MQREQTLTNLEYSRKSKTFLRDCAKVGHKPTARQASKYRRKTGFVWKNK